MNRLYFIRKRKDKQVLQELTWRSFTDCNKGTGNSLIDLVLTGEYVVTTVALPRHMVEGSSDDLSHN